MKTNNSIFKVEDTQYLANQVIGHFGRVEQGKICRDELIIASIDKGFRTETMKNHSATHLLHKALKNLLGAHIQQKGSLVAPDRLRFDFSHNQPLNESEIIGIEREVNEEIRANRKVESSIMDLEVAKTQGAEALFGEKYDSEVRVIRMGDYSMELCGGTHVERTGDIGLFKIVGETGIASGVRRIEALTGESALDRVQEETALLQCLAEKLSTSAAEIKNKVAQVLEKNRLMEQEITELKMQLVTGTNGIDTDNVQMVRNVQVLVSRHDGLEVKELRQIMDKLRTKLGSGVVFLGSVHEDKATLLCTVTPDLVERIDASEIIRRTSDIVGGRGGGKRHMAQGGGADIGKIDMALGSVYELIQ